MIFVNPLVVFPNPTLGPRTQPVIPSPPANTLLTDLISYWSFDGNSTDLHGTNNGTDISVSYVTGKINNAVGGWGYVNVGSANLNLPTLSMSCWVKMNSTGNYYFVLSRLINNGAFQNTYEIRITPGGNIEVLTTAPGSVLAYTYMSTGTWHHIGVTRNYDGATKIYFNGSEVASGNLAYPTSLPSQDTLIGTRNDQYTTMQNAIEIDELGIWNKLLTAGEITSLYNGGAGIAYPF